MNANKLRNKYLRFFEKRGHHIIPSASLIPENDPTVLFTTAGMHPLVPYLMGESHPEGRRLTDVQKCVRTGDIDEVGDDTHLTFFEMLGNWSLQDYFKKETIEWSFTFLTQELHIPLERLAVSVFAGDKDAPFDEDAYDLWMKQGIKARGTRSKKRVENFLDLKNTIGHLKNDAKKTINFNIAHSKRETKKLIEFQSMSFSYGEKDLFTNINLTINKKEKIGLLGPNGIGKTTLVKLIEGSLTPSSGYRKAAENLIIKHFTQKRDELDPEMTPYQLLGEGTDHVTLNGYKQHVITYFESFLFKSTEIHRPLKSFSGGEKNRLQLAFNLKQAGDLLIFDEPTNDLDLETLEILEKKLEEHEGALVVISHDRSFLANVTNTTWLIADSKIEFFQAGYSQVEDYLEALRIEHELLQKEDKKIELSRPTPTVDDPKRLTNKQKERLKTIDMDIHNKEATLESLEMKLGEFDYSNMDQEKTIKLQKLHEQRDQIELELLDLYEEMGTLNSST